MFWFTDKAREGRGGDYLGDLSLVFGPLVFQSDLSNSFSI